MATLMQQAFRRKPVMAMAAETGADSEGGTLSRSIGLFQLSMIGIGSTIGTGIFFVIAGLTALCYAELASAVPVSGSSYSYSYAYAYATLGEVVAMGVAACLLLEYGVSSAAVAVG